MYKTCKKNEVGLSIFLAICVVAACGQHGAEGHPEGFSTFQKKTSTLWGRRVAR